MLPPKLKNRATWGKGDKNATGYEVVTDGGDKKMFVDGMRCPEDQGWKGAPREFIEGESAETTSPYERD